MPSEQKQSSDTYSLMVSCSNCGYRGTTHIPKGTTVNNSICPNCGCRTLNNYSFTESEPRMKFIDKWCDPVDRGLRPKEFPWLNTIMSTFKDYPKGDIELRWVDDNGNKDFQATFDGKPFDVSDEIINLFGD